MGFEFLRQKHSQVVKLIHLHLLRDPGILSSLLNYVVN
jgi:hypothetical protein